MPEPDLDWFGADNAKYESWWSGFTAGMDDGLPETRGKWVLTGSRSFGLAYPESDIEGAVIVRPEDHETIERRLSEHLAARGWKHTVTVTRAGLRLFILDDVPSGTDGVTIWKLEFTIREPEVHQTIASHIERQLQSWTDEQQLLYIQEQRADALLGERDPAARARHAARKEWLRVLLPQRQPPKE
ncbi:hypothetical protein [Nocardioides kribbensis]|uniref:GrpB family protein n=1 Tax=Nocardioides kribbensis TaxID=305517 RepID=A0ABV1NTC1_9ACTN